MTKLSIPALALAACLALGPARAAAGDHCSYRTVTVYETVTVCEVRQVPYTCTVIRYDECGCPYRVQVTRYRDVKVCVIRTVPVKRRVPVYE
jgi:hypothetical protein